MVSVSCPVSAVSIGVIVVCVGGFCYVYSTVSVLSAAWLNKDIYIFEDVFCSRKYTPNSQQTKSKTEILDHLL